MTDLRVIATADAPALPALPPLPEAVVDLLVELGAPPRLVAHLRAVHDAAVTLVTDLRVTWPHLVFDDDAVLVGAAVHDIGKTIHPSELSGPGALHEQDGVQLLLDHGFAPSVARFASTHAKWADVDASLEDQLVALADKTWKGRRQDDLEQLLIENIAAETGGEPWHVFSALDEIIDAIARNADARLAFQNQHPT